MAKRTETEKGYYIVKDTYFEGINKATGFPYRHYEMIRIRRTEDEDRTVHEVNFRGPTAKNGKCIALVECETKKGPAVKAQIETEQNTTYHRMKNAGKNYL